MPECTFVEQKFLFFLFPLTNINAAIRAAAVRRVTLAE